MNMDVEAFIPVADTTVYASPCYPFPPDLLGRLVPVRAKEVFVRIDGCWHPASRELPLPPGCDGFGWNWR